MTREQFLAYYPDYPKWKQAVYDHYGRRCTCCGATYDLTVDHVNGDGKEERKRYGRTWLKHVIDLGFPPVYQVLCRSCNSSKATGPFCRIHCTAYGDNVPPRGAESAAPDCRHH